MRRWQSQCFSSKNAQAQQYRARRKTRVCRILLPCRKQLQAQLDHIETIERANLKTAISKSSLRPTAAHGAEPLQQSGHAGWPEISLPRGSRWRSHRSSMEQQPRCRARISLNLLEQNPHPHSCLRHDGARQAACRGGHSRSGSSADHDNAFHSGAEELVSTGHEALAVRAFKVLEAIGCSPTEYDIKPQNRI